MKNIYITWHYTTHGVAYFKHVLSAFYKYGIAEDTFPIEKLDQEKLNELFNQKIDNGFVFDELIYLAATQEAFDNISSRRFNRKMNIAHDDKIMELNLEELYRKIRNDDSICYKMDKEIEFIKSKFPHQLTDFEQTVWRNIQHYSVDEQVKWLNNKSNFTNIYPPLKHVYLSKITDLRNEKLIADELNKWMQSYLKKQKEDVQLFINTSLGSHETQVVWYVLAEADKLSENTRFFKTHDDKSSIEARFKLFSIKEIAPKLISSITEQFSIFPETKSAKRELVDKKMEVFLKSGFAILLLGERGIGKSQIAGKAKQKLTEQDKSFKGEIIEANCASFDDDSKAEAELFGYRKGAFTGANAEKKGLLEAAEDGVLFLDEIHHLSKFVQAKLMKALQTDGDNRLSIRCMGGNRETKVKDVRLIFATNKTIKELRKLLLPDFYDRIVQHVIHIPPLRETIEDRETDWENIWKELKLKGKAPKNSQFINWLRKLPLYGNYRDLQKIAMYYDAFNKFDNQLKEMISEKTAFEYVKNEFENYHSTQIHYEHEKFNFNSEQTTKEMIADYLFELQNWAVKQYGGRKKAIEHFKSLDDKVTEKTFNNWKNKKSC